MKDKGEGVGVTRRAFNLLLIWCWGKEREKTRLSGKSLIPQRISEEVSASRSCSLEECSMGQKWPGSRIPIVITHWLAAWGDSGFRVNAVMDPIGGSWRLSAPCMPHSLMTLAGRSEQCILKTAIGITPTPWGCSTDQISYVCAAASFTPRRFYMSTCSFC